jgi:hypothetical protein
MGLSTTGKEELLGTVIQSSNFPGDSASNAFDESYSTFWAGASAGQEWVGMDCGAGISATLTDVEISAEYTSNELRAVGSLIQGAASTAFTSPTTYYTVPDPTAGGVPWLAGNRRNRIPISGASPQRCFRYMGSGTAADGFATVARLRFIVAAGSGANSRPVVPKISPWGGGYTSGSQTVTITSETTSAAIYYTVGTFASPPADPDNVTGTLYTGPFTQAITNAGVVIKAVAYDTTCSTPLSAVSLPAYFRNYAFGMPDNTKPETLIYDITDGEKVEAASGSPYYRNGTYYLPTVSGLSGGPTDQLGRYGVWMYTSTDRINWAKVGINGNVIPNPSWGAVANIIRNQILYDAVNAKWVMWSNVSGGTAGDKFWIHTTTGDPASASTTWTSVGSYVPPGLTATADHSLFPCSMPAFPSGWGMVYTPETQTDGLKISPLSADFLSFTAVWSVPDLSDAQGFGTNLAVGEGCVAFQIGSRLAIVFCHPSTFYQCNTDKLGFNVVTTTDPSNTAAYSNVAIDAFYTTNPFDVNVNANNQPNYVFTVPGKSNAYVLFGAAWRLSPESSSNPIQFPIDVSNPLAPKITQNVTASWDDSVFTPSSIAGSGTASTSAPSGAGAAQLTISGNGSASPVSPVGSGTLSLLLGALGNGNTTAASGQGTGGFSGTITGTGGASTPAPSGTGFATVGNQNQSNGLSVSLTSPLSGDGKLLIISGDDYKLADSRSVLFNLSGLNLVGAQATLVLAQFPHTTDTPTRIAGVIVANSVSFDIPSETTSTLVCGDDAYLYKLVITLADGSVITPAWGSVDVLDPTEG